MASLEYILKSFADDAFVIWRSSSSVVIGRNQNVSDVVDIDYVLMNEIPIIRRLTGGSSYYQDMGTVNFAVICSHVSDNKCMLDISNNPFTAPIKSVIDVLGVGERTYEASEIFIGKNMYLSYSKMKYKEKILIQGSIMLSTDTSRFKSSSLRNTRLKNEFHNRDKSGIISLNSILKEQIDEDKFIDMVIDSFKNSFINTKYYSFNNVDSSYINTLAKEKYSQPKWNLGDNLNYNQKYDKLYDYGQISAHLEVNNGIIQRVKFVGDFFSSQDLNELEEKFVGIRYNFIEINRLINRTDISKYIYDVDKEDLIKLLI